MGNGRAPEDRGCSWSPAAGYRDADPRPAGRELSGMTCLPVVGQTLEAPLEKQEQGQGL